MASFCNKLRFELFNGFKNDFHVVELFTAGNHDGFIKMVVLPFSKDKTNVFSFVGRDAFFVNENTSVKTKFFAVKDSGAVASFIDAFFKLFFHSP